MTTEASLSLRSATPQDCRFVWQVNNHPSVRAQSISTGSIPWSDHQGWYRGVLERADRLLWIAQANDTSVGVVRFDIDARSVSAEISVALAPSARGRGLGKRLIAEASRRACDDAKLRTLIAYIRPENKASLHAFEAAGYRPVTREKAQDILLWRYEYQPPSQLATESTDEEQ